MSSFGHIALGCSNPISPPTRGPGCHNARDDHVVDHSDDGDDYVNHSGSKINNKKINKKNSVNVETLAPTSPGLVLDEPPCTK